MPNSEDLSTTLLDNPADGLDEHNENHPEEGGMGPFETSGTSNLKKISDGNLLVIALRLAAVAQSGALVSAEHIEEEIRSSSNSVGTDTTTDISSLFIDISQLIGTTNISICAKVMRALGILCSAVFGGTESSLNGLNWLKYFPMFLRDIIPQLKHIPASADFAFLVPGSLIQWYCKFFFEGQRIRRLIATKVGNATGWSDYGLQAALNYSGGDNKLFIPTDVIIALGNKKASEKLAENGLIPDALIPDAVRKQMNDGNKEALLRAIAVAYNNAGYGPKINKVLHAFSIPVKEEKEAEATDSQDEQERWKLWLSSTGAMFILTALFRTIDYSFLALTGATATTDELGQGKDVMYALTAIFATALIFVSLCYEVIGSKEEYSHLFPKLPYREFAETSLVTYLTLVFSITLYSLVLPVIGQMLPSLVEGNNAPYTYGALALLTFFGVSLPLAGFDFKGIGPIIFNKESSASVAIQTNNNPFFFCLKAVMGIAGYMIIRGGSTAASAALSSDAWANMLTYAILAVSPLGYAVSVFQYIYHLMRGFDPNVLESLFKNHERTATGFAAVLVRAFAPNMTEVIAGAEGLFPGSTRDPLTNRQASVFSGTATENPSTAMFKRVKVILEQAVEASADKTARQLASLYSSTSEPGGMHQEPTDITHGYDA